MPRRLLVAALAALLLPAPASAVDGGVVGTGIHHAGVSEIAAASDVLSTSAPGHRWVRVMESWPMLQPDGPRFGDELRNLDTRIRAFAAADISVLLMVTGAPNWAHPGKTGGNHPPDKAADYAAMMAALAARYKGDVQALEVWNEPDDDDVAGDFWRGAPDPARYAELLKATHTAVAAAARAGDFTRPLIVTGGMVGNHFDFVDGIYEAGARGSFDAIGVHTDTACLQRSPDEYYREPDGRIGRYTFSGYREVRREILEHGDDVPIWMTEIGWAATSEPCDMGNDKGKRAGGVSEAKQAQMLRQAYNCLQHDPYVQVALWFSLQDAGADAKRSAFRYGLIGWNGQHKPSFSAFQDVFRSGPTATFCGGKVDADPPTVTIAAPPKYWYRLITSGTATDPSTPVKKIELWANGKRVLSQKGSTFKYDWFGSSKLPYGQHTVELRAYDEAGNVGRASTVVQRGRPDGPRTVHAKLRLRARRAGGRAIRVAASIARADTVLEHPYGRLELRFEHREKGRWDRSRVRKGIGSGRVRYTYTARQSGRWRVYAVLKANAPYKRTRTEVFTFRLP